MSSSVSSKWPEENDYANEFIHTGTNPITHVRNASKPREGYPKLEKLHQLKEIKVAEHAVKPYGCRISTPPLMIQKLNNWITSHALVFDVIMIGALAENQFIMPLLTNLPIQKLCAKPGYLFIWATTQKIQELTKILNNQNFNSKFRRLEELIFIQCNQDTGKNFGPEEYQTCERVPLLQRQQWHCWMCITGTVRRLTDNHLIHCNVDTDLQIQTPQSANEGPSAVPDAMYKIAENFSNSNRRLHIIPSRIGYNVPVRPRKGWVIMLPDIILDNFDPVVFQNESYEKSKVNYVKNMQPQFLVPQSSEIEELRPKSPNK